jgi:hypothetical protein
LTGVVCTFAGSTADVLRIVDQLVRDIDLSASAAVLARPAADPY